MILDKLEVCKETRKLTASSLFKVLKDLLKTRDQISEKYLGDAWYEELTSNKEIFHEGWYVPPPQGIGVLFATEKNPSRLKFKSLRQEEFWPRNDVFLNKQNGIAMVYASPVHKVTGIIGDFGLTIYLGNNKTIQKELRKYLFIVQDVFRFIKIGMKISEIHTYISALVSSKGFTNEWWMSITDPTGTNFGHTIPATDTNWTAKERQILLKGENNWDRVIGMISQKRKFINEYEESVVREGMALTVEPRLIVKNNPKMPTVYYHTIVTLKENGKKELLTNFDEIFRLTGMNYLIRTLDLR